MEEDRKNIEWREQAKENAEQIALEIESLSCGHWSNFVREYNKFFLHVKEISVLFKTLKPLLKEDREKLWAEFNTIITDVKAEQTRQRENLRSHSNSKRELIEDVIEEGRLHAKSAESRTDFQEASEILKKALAMMKTGWGGFSQSTQMIKGMTSDEGRLLKEDHDACWERYQDANETWRNRRNDVWESNRYYFQSKVSEVSNLVQYSHLKEAKQLIQSIQKEMRESNLSKESSQFIREDLDRLWESAVSQQQSKHEEWKRKQESFIDNQEDAVSRRRELISRLEGQIDHLHGLDYSERIQGWIDEKEDIIRKIKDEINDMLNKIQDARSRLS